MVRHAQLFRAYLCLAAASLILAIAWHQSFDIPATKPQAFPSHFYQHAIGTLDGRSCPSYPVCSQYATQAMHQYGLLFGSWLALDRLIHEGDDLRLGPWLFLEGDVRLNDPVARNAFWLGLR